MKASQICEVVLLINVALYYVTVVFCQDPTPVIIRDPRSRMARFWSKREPANLPVPNFKVNTCTHSSQTIKCSICELLPEKIER